MDLPINPEEKIIKKSFKLNRTSTSKDGLLLRIHHSIHNSHKLRFLYSCFNEPGNLNASSDNKGRIFIINITGSKFWGLPNVVDSCTFLKFSSFRACEILIGLKTCEIIVVNYEIGKVTARLVGHDSPPSMVSFSKCRYCLSSSETEAIIWDLQDNSRLKILALESDSLLKYVSFISNSELIFGCYTDNSINIWKFGTFQAIRMIEASIWNGMDLKNFAFSCDGSSLAISSIHPTIAIYSLKAWKILKFINLPEYVKSIKTFKFMIFEKFKTSILAVLSGNGILSFFDTSKNIVISELKSIHEIVKFDHADNAAFLSCVLCTGDIELYDTTMYVENPTQVTALTKKKLKIKALNDRNKVDHKKIEELKDELDDVLQIERLKSILKEYGEYPEAYRNMIWEQLLQLPNNEDNYNGIIKNRVHEAFENLNNEYQLQCRSLKSTKMVLNNLVTWCNFFANVQYLPVFAYPFVKVFQNRPIVCFEAIATILLNWCQYWFEYHPLPPINILAIVENILSELDLELFHHLNKHDIISKQYAWPLLESAFSEVLTTPSWYVFWDHVLTNEPSFLLCAVAAYNLIQRKAILKLKDATEIEHFYHKHNPLNVKRLIAKCYWLMDNKTELETHPRKYLNGFKGIEKGSYPIFHGYPKVMVENESEKMRELKRELEDIDLEEAKLLLNKRKEIDRMLDVETIEKRRLYEMKKACNEQCREQQSKATLYLQRLDALRKKFDVNESKLLKYTKSEQLRRKATSTDLLYSEPETNMKEDEFLNEKAETSLLRHYSELLKHKIQIEALLDEDSSSFDEPKLHEMIRREHEKILREIEKIYQLPNAEFRIRQYNMVSSLLAMDDLIKKVETALAKELSKEYLDLKRSETTLKNIKLQAETEELEMQVVNLLNDLSRSRVTEENNMELSTHTKPSSLNSQNKSLFCHFKNESMIPSTSSDSNFPLNFQYSTEITDDDKHKIRGKRINTKSVKFKKTRASL